MFYGISIIVGYSIIDPPPLKKKKTNERKSIFFIKVQENYFYFKTFYLLFLFI